MEKFKSKWKNYFIDFIELKRSLNFSYNNHILTLKSFDDFLFHNKQYSVISKESIYRWIDYNKFAPSSLYQRMICIRHFSEYLNGLSIESYIPPLPPFKKRHSISYIYSFDELKSLFIAADNLNFKCFNGRSSIIVVPIVLRLLYVTGMRVGELINLKKSDVDLKNGVIRITTSKNGKERQIPIEKSITDILVKHHKKRSSYVNENNSEYFFCNLRGDQISIQSLHNWFKKCLITIGIKRLNGRPRLHDLRHTFAVNSLSSLLQQGINFPTALLLLSVYLGHSNPNSSARYLRLTRKRYPKMMRQLNDFYCTGSNGK